MNEDKKKLLLVDDVDLFLHLEISFLGRKSFEIFTAKSAQETLLKAQQHKPDLIILDMVMPEMTGDEICRLLKNETVTSKIPVVIVSSMAAEEVRHKCIDAGCSAFITKPISREIFLSTVREQLNILMRKHERVDVEIPCKIVRGVKSKDATLRSLSQSGAFIETDDFETQGTAVELIFAVPPHNQDVKLEAVTVWSGKLTEAGPKGYGVRFFTPGLEEKTMIGKLLEQFKKEQGSE